MPQITDISYQTKNKSRCNLFVDGEFWHGKDWEKRTPRLKSNREYWIEKIEENMARDDRNNKELQHLGWQVIRFWEKDVKKDVNACASTVIEAIADTLEEITTEDLTERESE